MNQSASTCKASFSLCIVDMNGKEVYVGAKQEQVFNSGDNYGSTNFAALPLMTCINNNTLTIRASITLPPSESVGEVIVSGTEDLIFQGEKNSLCSTIHSLCGDDSLPHDVWLLAPGPGQNPQEIGAHKFVLAARSPVFRAMLKGQMKEAQRSEVEISDFDSTTVKAFVRFLHSDRCSREALSECAEALLAMADKYAVPALFTLCECYLTTHLCAENAMALLCLADAHSAAQLKASALQYIVGHPKAWRRTRSAWPRTCSARCCAPLLAASRHREFKPAIWFVVAYNRVHRIDYEMLNLNLYLYLKFKSLIRF
jgi:speckle-type POZ protein